MEPSETDLYTLLDLSPDADEEAIRRACARASATWSSRAAMSASVAKRHAAEAMVQTVAQARAVLLDPGRRAVYDERRSHGADPVVGPEQMADAPEARATRFGLPAQVATISPVKATHSSRQLWRKVLVGTLMLAAVTGIAAMLGVTTLALHSPESATNANPAAHPSEMAQTLSPVATEHPARPAAILPLNDPQAQALAGQSSVPSAAGLSAAAGSAPNLAGGPSSVAQHDRAQTRSAARAAQQASRRARVNHTPRASIQGRSKAVAQRRVRGNAQQLRYKRLRGGNGPRLRDF